MHIDGRLAITSHLNDMVWNTSRPYLSPNCYRCSIEANITRIKHILMKCMTHLGFHFRSLWSRVYINFVSHTLYL